MLWPFVPGSSRSPLDQSSTRLILGSVFYLVAVFRPVATANRRPPSEHGRRTDDSISRQAQEPEETILYFPDYVDGGGWSVQLVLSNVDPDAAAEVRVEVYDPDGQPILDLFGSDLTLEIPSLGSRVLRSAGGGTIRRGWIQVQTRSAAVSGLLTYRSTPPHALRRPPPARWSARTAAAIRRLIFMCFMIQPRTPQRRVHAAPAIGGGIASITYWALAMGIAQVPSETRCASPLSPESVPRSRPTPYA